MAEKKKYNSILISGRKDQTLTYSKHVKDEESGESVKESLDKKVNVTDKLETHQIKDGAITNEKMAAGSVGNTNLQDGSVSNEKLEDGSITNEKLAENSITKDKLKDNTIGIEKLDPELRQTINAATGLTENLVETIQNVDATLKDHQSQLDDKQSQIDDKQQQITANDEDISLLQTRSTQMEETIKSIAATGGASQATAVTYNNEKSKLTALNIQSAVDEVVEKTAIKDEEGVVVDTPFHYIQNEEFIFAKVDAEDKFLFGIQWDGTPVFGKTSAVEDILQTQVTLLAEKVATIIGDEDTTNVIDTMNELKKFFAEIDNTQTLTSILANLDKTTIKDEEGNVQDTPFRVIENEEFVMAVVDSEDKVLFGIYRATGKPYYPQNDMYHISQSEEFLWVILDTANHPLLGIQQDGTCWAAKAQWLDDIKAIKEALSNIDETLKTFQPKEDGKGLINLDVADSFFYISNDEYIIAVVDAENRILVGIKYDGEPYFPNHEMYSVITNEEWLYAIIDTDNKVLGGFHADDGHMIVGSIDISAFITNSIIDIADIKERTAHLSTMDNDEYLSVETDADGKVIGYTAHDGSHYLYKVKSETIPTEFEHIDDPEGRTEITTDSKGNIISYRDKEGTLNETKIAVNNLLIKNKKSFLDENRRNGFDVSPIDYSFETELHISQPTCAKVNFSGVDNIPQEKFANAHGYMEFWDMNGNYFKKEVIMNAQGRSSLGFPKKNIAIDICNNNGFDDSDTFKLQIGDWVPQDSFHLKGYINDPFRGICPVSYKLYDEIVKTRGIFNDYVWKRAIVNTSNITETSNGAETQEETAKQFDTGARCFPDGFPCIVYLNNEFYGIYSWQLKKHRDNYHLDKKNADNIHLDGNITDASILNANGDASKIGWNALDVWHGFEIRNPKNLILMNGSKYDADFNAGELIDDSSSAYNPSDKNHILSSKVKKHILELSKVMTKLSDAKNTYDLSSKDNSDKEMFKSVFETYFDIDNLIDYLILSDVVRHADGFGDNWQWFTYNGVKWYIGLYDTDMILGNQAGLVQTIDPPLDHHVCQTYQYKYLLEFYTDELQARYKKLRDIKIIDADHICNLLKEWMDRIGNRSVFEKEWNKWSVFVKNDSLYRVKKWLDNSIKNMDSIYKYNV